MLPLDEARVKILNTTVFRNCMLIFLMAFDLVKAFFPDTCPSQVLIIRF